jgi:hypothetical protein
MIRNDQARSAIAQEWATVRKFCAGSHRQYQIPGGGFINETPPESFFNLPFLLAYGVLDHVLEELVGQGTFQCSKGPLSLGNRMFSSVNAVPWQDFALVDAGKIARNDLAHDAKLLGKMECFRFIDAIEMELKAWRVL